MGLVMSSQTQLKQQEKPILEDRRKYECTIHGWGKPPYTFCIDWLDGNPEDPPPGEVHINIRTFLKERYCLYTNMQETHTNIVRYDFFNVPMNSIKQAINYILSILNVPEENQVSLAQQILDYTKNTTKHYRDHYMIMMLDADIFYHKHDNDGRTPSKDQACQAKSASDNRFKGVKLEFKETWGIFKESCAICWGKLRDDAVELPCSHFYHGNCILQWSLRKKKNYCNRCYFEFDTP